MTRETITLTKVGGGEQRFDPEKLRASLLRSGADDTLLEMVVRDVVRELRPGDSTDKVRRLALGALQREARHLAGRYDLKRAVRKLGPSGYAFERLWGALLETLGFSVTFDVMVPGRCVEHEVDVVAERTHHRRLAECKFHNAPATRTDVTVALYVYARSLDLRERDNRPDGTEHFELVTNTRFTDEALRYGQCVGLRMISWDFPANGSLRDLVDRHALYPITCLSSLKTRAAKDLLAEGVVTCRQLVHAPERLEVLGLSSGEVREVLREATPLQRIGEVVRHAPEELRRST